MLKVLSNAAVCVCDLCESSSLSKDLYYWEFPGWLQPNTPVGNLLTQRFKNMLESATLGTASFFSITFCGLRCLLRVSLIVLFWTDPH